MDIASLCPRSWSKSLRVDIMRNLPISEILIAFVCNSSSAISAFRSLTSDASHSSASLIAVGKLSASMWCTSFSFNLPLYPSHSKTLLPSVNTSCTYEVWFNIISPNNHTLTIRNGIFMGDSRTNSNHQNYGDSSNSPATPVTLKLQVGFRTFSDLEAQCIHDLANCCEGKTARVAIESPLLFTKVSLIFTSYLRSPSIVLPFACFAKSL